MKREARSVGRKCEGKIQYLGIFDSLLNAMLNAVAFILGFDNCQRQILFMVEKVVSTLSPPSRGQIAANDYTTCGKINFFPDLIFRPA